MRNRALLTVVLLVLTTGLLGTAQPVAAPDVALVGGHVFTGVEAAPWAEALAVQADRLSLVGSNAQVRAAIGPATRVIELAGRVVVPGFNDAHLHLGARPASVDLEGPSPPEHDPTLDEVIIRLKAAAARASDDVWLMGEIGGTVLDDPRADRATLDAVVPTRKVALQAWTGHGMLLNTAALRHFDIAEDEPNPPGGEYVRRPGTTTVSGVLHEYAEYKVRTELAREAGRPAQLAAVEAVAREAVGLGVTSVQAMTMPLPLTDAIEVVSSLQQPLRMRLIDFPLTPLRDWRALKRLPATSTITVSGTKWILDGTPVERLMLLREPYADRHTKGAANFSLSELQGFLAGARDAGEQPMIHAVGDGAIDQVLAGLEATGGEAWRSLRPRIEHGDLLRADQFDRARRFGVVIVHNPSHFMIPDVMRARLGAARQANVQAVKTTLAAGIPIAIGSDGPINPFLNLMFAATHADNPREALSVEQALIAYTRGSAFAEFQETTKGTLAAGMLADLAVLSQDIFSVPANQLPATTSALTMIGGRIVHERP